MIYVYILEADTDEDREHFYAGITEDLKKRVRAHNAGEVFHTAKFKSWTLKNYFAFKDRKKPTPSRNILNPVQEEPLARSIFK
jgi:predicted GIY-YIG superfamily endonuclease